MIQSKWSLYRPNQGWNLKIAKLGLNTRNWSKHRSSHKDLNYNRIFHKFLYPAMVKEAKSSKLKLKVAFLNILDPVFRQDKLLLLSMVFTLIKIELVSKKSGIQDWLILDKNKGRLPIEDNPIRKAAKLKQKWQELTWVFHLLNMIIKFTTNNPLACNSTLLDQIINTLRDSQLTHNSQILRNKDLALCPLHL